MWTGDMVSTCSAGTHSAAASSPSALLEEGEGGKSKSAVQARMAALVLSSWILVKTAKSKSIVLLQAASRAASGQRYQPAGSVPVSLHKAGHGRGKLAGA